MKRKKTLIIVILIGLLAGILLPIYLTYLIITAANISNYKITNDYFKGPYKINGFQIRIISAIDSISKEGIPYKYNTDTSIQCTLDLKNTGPHKKIYLNRQTPFYKWWYIKPGLPNGRFSIPIHFIYGKWYEIPYVNDDHFPPGAKILFHLNKNNEIERFNINSNISPI